MRRPARKRPGKVARAIDRAVLGALMTLAALVVERRLRKAFRKAAEPDERDHTVEIS